MVGFFCEIEEDHLPGCEAVFQISSDFAHIKVASYPHGKWNTSKGPGPFFKVLFLCSAETETQTFESAFEVLQDLRLIKVVPGIRFTTFERDPGLNTVPIDL